MFGLDMLVIVLSGFVLPQWGSDDDDGDDKLDPTFMGSN